MRDVQNSEVAPVIERADRHAVAAIEVDLAKVRSRITDLRAESLSLAAELLAVLGPLERTLERAVQGPNPDMTTSRTDEPIQIIELTRTFEDTQPAVLKLSETDASAQPMVLDLSSTRFEPWSPVGANN